MASKGVWDFTDIIKLQVSTISFPVNVTLTKNTRQV